MKQFHFPIILLRRLAVLLLVYTLLRLVFFLFNRTIFSGHGEENFIAFIAGLRFDVSAIIYTNLLFIFLHLIPFNIRFKGWYQKLTTVVFYVFNIPAFILAVADFEFYKFNGKRISSDVLGLGGSFLKMLPQFMMDYWNLLVIIIVFILLTAFLYRKIKVDAEKRELNFFVQLLLLIIFSGIFIVGLRGGTQKHPISPLAACNYVDVSKMALVTNTPFEFIQSVSRASLERKNYFSSEEASRRFNIQTKFNHGDGFRPDNVVIIILESFSKDFVGALNPGKESFTPFLDSLIAESLAFENAYSNGWRSMQAVVSVMGSIPSLMDEPFMYSKYQDNKIYGLGTILKNKGYTTSFFHGGNNGEFKFDWFTKAAGFDHYHGRDEFNNEKEYDGGYGIYDEPFFQYFADETDKLKEPFCSVIFSLSSHYPYHLPEKFKNKFKKRKDPIYECIGYADYSLRQFFISASKKKWFDNTLFVLTADHAHEKITTDKNNSTDFFFIPILFYKKSGDLKGMASYLIQQVDIMPSILDYLHYDERFITFGKSVFDSSGTRYTYQYLDRIYHIIDNKNILYFNGTKTIGFYNYDMKEDLKDLKAMSEDKERLENQIKAIIQVYNNSLIENKLSLH